VWDLSDEDPTRMLANCPQKVVRVGLVEFGERHDTRTNGQHYRTRQLYKNIYMLFLFPVKHGKLSTGFNATFDASCYG